MAVRGLWAMAATMALILFPFAGILVHAGVDHHLLWSDSTPGTIFTFSLGDNLVNFISVPSKSIRSGNGAVKKQSSSSNSSFFFFFNHIPTMLPLLPSPFVALGVIIALVVVFEDPNQVITNNTPDGFLFVSALHHINCNTSEPFSIETGALTVIPLTDTQTRFIISERADLCRDGLKWQVNVRDPVQEANEAP
ncbi:hypothetical protein Pint_16664 [Pistacia integerrima]|uniref:Uncharacterized protein n=1 Tax=Pistacia integerrima TaxID=434235 RepID=A0ACC0ZCW0_9ROSI|nr:hypothetical protein Pint_16664 [Pistacia integerrima]